jgi:RNA polymerase sigma-70 factor, ECF subfamily
LTRSQPNRRCCVTPLGKGAIEFEMVNCMDVQGTACSATLATPIAGSTGLRGLDLHQSGQYTRALDNFLAEVERKALRMAQIALRHEDDALDAVQDAMIKLVSSYAARPSSEWKPLFYRILENCIRDQQRRRTVRGRVMSWMPWRSDEDESEADPLEQAPDPSPGPVAHLEGDEIMRALQAALQLLPGRQRQAFLLRNLEGLDTAETAAAMGCSEGSVKTHYSRALHTLQAQLGEFWI